MSRNAVIVALVAALLGAAVGAGAVLTGGFSRVGAKSAATAPQGNPAERPKEAGEHKEKAAEVRLKPGQVELGRIKAVAVAPGSIGVELVVPGKSPPT